MHDRNLRSLIFDHNDKAMSMHRRISSEIEDGIRQWQYSIPPSPQLFSCLLDRHAKDLCEMCLHRAVRQTVMDNKTYYLTETYPHMNDMEKAALIRTFMEAGGIDMHNEITSYIGLHNYDVWNAIVENGYLKLDYVGDFRVMQWEREHVVDGMYYPNPIVN